MVVWHDSQLPPTIHNRKETEVVIRHAFLRVQDLVTEQELFFPLLCAEDRRTCGLDAPFQFLPVAA
jgi:hypothetical protein